MCDTQYLLLCFLFLQWTFWILFWICEVYEAKATLYKMLLQTLEDDQVLFGGG